MSSSETTVVVECAVCHKPHDRSHPVVAVHDGCLSETIATLEGIAQGEIDHAEEQERRRIETAPSRQPETRRKNDRIKARTIALLRSDHPDMWARYFAQATVEINDEDEETS